MKKFFSHLIQHFLLCHLQMILIAALIDALWGEPKYIYNKIPHPIIWIGKLIDYLDKKLNHTNDPAQQQKQNGFVALSLTIAIPCLVGIFLQKILFKSLPKPIAYFLSGVIASIFIAKRSLYEHVHEVEKALTLGDIKSARYAVSQIVGRKTDQLDSSGIARAAIESLAENFSDGVIAPIFWGCIGGLPGIITYKAINTADSMIGHKTKKYKFFGFAAAKSDDYVNYPAARLSALLIILTTSKKPFSDLKFVAKEAKKHNSPNAGWPEAAMATRLSILLAGPRQYQNYVIDSPWIGTGKSKLNQIDIQNALDTFSFTYNKSLTFLIIITLILKKFK
ncbi:adenosylcobinamide-phosphate synthase CbiB [Commensalibacter papalotli (ex Botero et al. 2024)]|uniref:Cobalamin biosynthesis protein CobD n=1 Tax=Commensalibacter papalotli (ex Botero et al. 2024) TaxID=2972766 RepID=A0ABN8WFS9_9PROT|nr:adenosylcobinamide-phosphate synthase CbiB [Commensalibacter papalotli (ex Botero et al. 2024)]CAI3953354.1 Cobalamin biosynthesis protein CobD/CbiB (CbiB) [Commensalibacter papalotli (ex Botero et al. 2024)]CAI3953861.1 Cobalamin biosynthesis protein CobD/CbiB (CbiB) [Commensalibacter papalotli (ex Botero et al. 2024)]